MEKYAEKGYTGHVASIMIPGGWLPTGPEQLEPEGSDVVPNLEPKMAMRITALQYALAHGWGKNLGTGTSHATSMDDQMFEDIRALVLSKHGWVIAGKEDARAAAKHKDVVSQRLAETWANLGFDPDDHVAQGKRLKKLFSYMYRHQQDPESWDDVENETQEQILASEAALGTRGLSDDDEDDELDAAPARSGVVASVANAEASSSDAPVAPVIAAPKRLPHRHKAHVDSMRPINEDGIPTGIGLFAGEEPTF